MKARAKPIEVLKFNNQYPSKSEATPDWYNDAIEHEMIEEFSHHLLVTLPNGVRRTVAFGDWVIQLCPGVLDSCPAQQFDKRYELNDGTAAATFSGIGWGFTDACAMLDKGEDPRTADIAAQLERANRDFKFENFQAPKEVKKQSSEKVVAEIFEAIYALALEKRDGSGEKAKNLIKKIIERW